MKNYLSEGPLLSGPHAEPEKRFLQFAHSFYAGADGESAMPFIVRSKIHHTFDVCRIAEFIMAGEKDFAGERARETGYFCALTHDLSRFPQFKEFGTLMDARSFDHGDRSCDILRTHAFPLPELAEEERGIVEEAVRVHNKKKIPEDLEKKVLPFAELVRDADKLSIIKVVTDYFQTPEEKRCKDVSLGFPDSPGYTEDVLEAAIAGKAISYQEIRCINDFKVILFHWPADLNYPSSAKYALENRLFEGLGEFLPGSPRMKVLVEVTRKRLELLASGEKICC